MDQLRPACHQTFLCRSKSQHSRQLLQRLTLPTSRSFLQCEDSMDSLSARQTNGRLPRAHPWSIWQCILHQRCAAAPPQLHHSQTLAARMAWTCRRDIHHQFTRQEAQLGQQDFLRIASCIRCCRFSLTPRLFCVLPRILYPSRPMVFHEHLLGNCQPRYRRRLV
eukprot:SAG31_NODE_2387_length_5809_cov_1.810683_6_plen_165_part_00